MDVLWDGREKAGKVGWEVERVRWESWKATRGNQTKVVPERPAWMG